MKTKTHSVSMFLMAFILVAFAAPALGHVETASTVDFGRGVSPAYDAKHRQRGV
jgi:hypothetical protein